jgi:hypothetical protein
MPKYDAMCPTCKNVQEYQATYEMRERGAPGCDACGEQMERVWLSCAYVTPERMWREGTGAMRGRRVLLNDCDDPWEGDGTNLCAEQSEEFMAKRKEFMHGKAANWGDRKGSIHFDVGGES